MRRARAIARRTSPGRRWAEAPRGLASARVLLGRRHVRLELGQPDVGVAVRGARQSPRGDRLPPDDDLGAVGHRRALELADARRSATRNTAQPLPDRREVVGVLRVVREIRRPRPARRVAPGVPGEERDLGRRQPVARACRRGGSPAARTGRCSLRCSAMPRLRRPRGRAPARSRCRGSRQDDVARCRRRTGSVRTTQRIRYWISVFGEPSR